MQINKVKKFSVGIDNYSLSPLHLSPLETLQWAKNFGAEGVAFSGLDNKNQQKITNQYLKDLRDIAQCNNLYLEWGGAQHIPRDMNSWCKKEIFNLCT